MTDLLSHPAFRPVLGALLFTLLSLWPVARIFRRNGQSPYLCLLMLPGVALPLAGIILCSAAFLLKRKPQVTA